jgi:putative restriction endonuclease
MLGLIAVTDYDWYEFLSSQDDLDEVNFWRPSDIRTPQQLRVGTPVIFKLKAEHGNKIVGFGVFARHEVLPAYMAWDWFDRKNGAADFPSMRARIEKLRPKVDREDSIDGSYRIGCLMLAEPIFFSRGDWIDPPSNWPPNTVQGKGYPLEEGEGRRVWQECLIRAAMLKPWASVVASEQVPSSPRFGGPTVIHPRLGQGIFRANVTGAYGRACAVTEEHSLPVLEAAHIRPYAEGGPHEVPNGLLLRSDLHRLFDRGYVGITADHRFVVSRKLKDDFENGRSYYPLHGNVVRVPARAQDHPAVDLLEWHRSNRFRG